jgi:hypothetical protein
MMDEVVGDAVRPQRISAVLIAGFALGALLLARWACSASFPAP